MTFEQEATALVGQLRSETRLSRDEIDQIREHAAGMINGAMARIAEQERQIANLDAENSDLRAALKEERRANDVQARALEHAAESIEGQAAAEHALEQRDRLLESSRHLVAEQTERAEEAEARVKELEQQVADLRLRNTHLLADQIDGWCFDHQVVLQGAWIADHGRCRAASTEELGRRLAAHRAFVAKIEDAGTDLPPWVDYALREVKRVDPDKFNLLKGKADWVHDEEPI